MVVDNNPKSITRATRELRYCGVCGDVIPKRTNVSWSLYGKRKYCGDRRCYLHKGSKLIDKGDQTPMSDYIGKKSRNGRMMADFNLGVLQAIEKIGDDVGKNDLGRGVICMYKGVPITAEIVKSANQWLIENWVGKPGQRGEEVKEVELSRDELVAQLESSNEALGLVTLTVAEYEELKGNGCSV